MKKHAGPIFAAVLLLLPSVYVGSYLALVRPVQRHHGYVYQYPRIGSGRGKAIFWPLQQIDGKFRPDSWRYDTYDESEWK